MNQFRLALRSLFKTPGVAILSLLTLSVGIGASVAMFSLMNSILLRPLAFPESDKLSRVYRTGRNFTEGDLAPADFLDLQRAGASVGQYAAYSFAGAALALQGQNPEFNNSIRASANFFEVIKARTALGRGFLPEDDRPGARRVVVLSNILWREQFASDPQIVGKTVRVDGEPAEVVGVLEEATFDTRLFGNGRFFRPLALTEEERGARNMTYLNVVGRRLPGVSAGSERAFVASFGLRNAADHPAENKDTSFRALGLLDSTSRPAARILLGMLIGLAAFVLLIACSNLANLLLARAMSRAREFAVRAALGASRRQLLAPVMMESAILAVMGAAGALLISMWTCDWIHSQIPDGGLQLNMSIDWRVMAFTLAVSTLTVLFFGGTPALFATRISIGAALKSNALNTTGSKGHHRLRSALVIAQFAMAMTLVAGAAFFVRGAYKALNEYNGWNSDQVLQGTLQLPKDYVKQADLEPFFNRVQERLQNIPGVESASLSFALPYRAFGLQRDYRGDGKNHASDRLRVGMNGISAGYFGVSGTRILAGREFNLLEAKGGQNVVIISENMARALFQNENPIGRRVAMNGEESPAWKEIVGVAGDVQSIDISKPMPAFQVYQPLHQDHWFYGDGKLAPVYVAVRAGRVPPESLTAAVRGAVMAVDPDLPIRELMTASASIARNISQMYLFRQLLSGFAAIGLGLAALGIYGALSRLVAQRTQEIGIRMALGAAARDTIRLVLSAGFRLAVIGCAIGLFGAFGVSKVIAAALPGIQGNSILILLIASAGMIAVALLACYLPARRAARINPLIALRSE
jgi:predicted permease